MATSVVEYLRRKKCSPFFITHDVYRSNRLCVVDGTDSIVWYPSFRGNSKQRRQARRALVKALNQ